MSIEVEIVGGPCDGKRMVLPTNRDGHPPLSIELLESPPWGEKDVSTVKGRYVRKLSSRSEGPLWYYVRQSNKA